MIYVMSDLHGNYDKYIEMLDLIHFSDKDTLYILGDVVDHGEDWLKILYGMIRRYNVYSILGNHEYIAIHCLKRLKNEITEESLNELTEEKI